MHDQNDLFMDGQMNGDMGMQHSGFRFNQIQQQYDHSLPNEYNPTYKQGEDTIANSLVQQNRRWRDLYEINLNDRDESN